jgi:hypothetical protein
VTIADAGHNLLVDAFDETVSDIRQFLRPGGRVGRYGDA